MILLALLEHLGGDMTAAFGAKKLSGATWNSKLHLEL